MTIKSVSSKRRFDSAGFTLVEFLIAVFLAAVVATAAMGIYVAQNSTLTARDEAPDMQANARAAAVELATRIRMAGFNVPEGIPKLQSSNTDPDTITITYDSGEFEDVTLESPMTEPYSELRCDGNDIGALNDGDWAFIYDLSTKSGEFFLATRVDAASATIHHSTMPLSGLYPAGSQVIMMKRFKYYIDSSDPDHPNLICWTHRTGPQVFAEDIADFNLRYVLAGGEEVDVFPDESMVREVIITLNASTDAPDREFDTNYEKRILRTMVTVRNLASQHDEKNEINDKL